MKVTCRACGASHVIAPPPWVLASGRPFPMTCSDCGTVQEVFPTGLAVVEDGGYEVPPSEASGRHAALGADLAPGLEMPAASGLAFAMPEPSGAGVGLVSETEEHAGPMLELSVPPSEPMPEAAGTGRGYRDVLTDPGRKAAPASAGLLLRQEGALYHVPDLATFQRWIVEKRVAREDEIGTEDGGFRKAGEDPDLTVFFETVARLEALETQRLELLPSRLPGLPVMEPLLTVPVRSAPDAEATEESDAGHTEEAPPPPPAPELPSAMASGWRPEEDADEQDTEEHPAIVRPIVVPPSLPPPSQAARAPGVTPLSWILAGALVLGGALSGASWGRSALVEAMIGSPGGEARAASKVQPKAQAVLAVAPPVVAPPVAPVAVPAVAAPPVASAPVKAPEPVKAEPVKPVAKAEPVKPVAKAEPVKPVARPPEPVAKAAPRVEPAPRPEPVRAPPPPPPSAPSISLEGLGYEGLVEAGWTSLDARDWSGSVAAFERASLVRPDGFDARYGLGYALLKKGRTSEAAEHLCFALGRAQGGDKAEIQGILDKASLTCGG